jgi:2-keto-4-pentenoate hydratase
MGLKTSETSKEIAVQLSEAFLSKKSVEPFTAQYPDLTVKEAYKSQLLLIDHLTSKGDTITGKKIGLTSKAMQALLGVDQPDYGHLFQSMEVKKGDSIKLNTLFQPKLEAEIAFVLNKDLNGPDVTVAEVLEATEYVVPAIEVVDSRVENWKIKLPDTVADNASCGLYILGDEKRTIEEIRLPDIQMKLHKDGNFENEGRGADVLGNPAECIAWLANKLSEFDISLKSGEVILSGALSKAGEMKEGNEFTAAFEGWETLKVKVD